jgi:TolA-binding protein
MKRAYITITVCVAVTALFAVPQVSGQSVMRNSGDARSSSPDSSKAGTSSVDDTTLKKAARAFPRIRQINLKVQEKLKETSGTQEQREVLDQAHNQETAITRQGAKLIAIRALRPSSPSTCDKRRIPHVPCKFATYASESNR